MRLISNAELKRGGEGRKKIVQKLAFDFVSSFVYGSVHNKTICKFKNSISFDFPHSSLLFFLQFYFNIATAFVRRKRQEPFFLNSCTSSPPPSWTQPTSWRWIGSGSPATADDPCRPEYIFKRLFFTKFHKRDSNDNHVFFFKRLLIHCETVFFFQERSL